MTIVQFDHRMDFPKFDICIVGAGPVGIAVAIAAEAAGLEALVLESGGRSRAPVNLDLSSAFFVQGTVHPQLNMTMRRGLGGTSRWWGGRLTLFDDVDFERRGFVAANGWPFGSEEMEPWYKKAVDYFSAGPPVFRSESDLWKALKDVSADNLERWAPEIDMGKKYEKKLRRSNKITILLNCTALRVNVTASRAVVDSLTIRNEGGSRDIEVKHIILACGGLETTRLLLRMRREYEPAFDRIEALGRYYSGHLSGKIARIGFADKRFADSMKFEKDENVYVRRRFQIIAHIQLKEKLQNAVFWLDNPPFFDASHRNGTLSLVWLILRSPLGRYLLPEGILLPHVGKAPYRYLEHASNVFRDPLQTICGSAEIIFKRQFGRPRPPGIILSSCNHVYSLHYHAEQKFNSRSVVRLSDDTDRFGVPKMVIDYRISEEDVTSIVKSHMILDKSLRRANVGWLEFDEKVSLEDAVTQNVGDGFHQIGTTRMGSDTRDSVVDSNCRVHGLKNLFVASTSVLPTSGQANPTLTAVALGMRLANRLAFIVSAGADKV